MAKELLHSFIDGMDNLGFSEEEILTILRSSLHEKRGERMTEIIKIENLWKRYGLKAVIRELNIEITEGKIIGLVGDNGSGKTTLMKMIAGLQHPSEGSITVAGEKVGLKKEIVSFMSDKSVFDEWMTVKDSLFFYRDFYKDFDIQKR